MSASNSSSASGATNRTDEANNVDKIRDILFGNQMKDYDAKFARLEERLKAEAEELRDDLKRRLASLEAYVKGELGALSEQLQTEKDERLQSDKGLSVELKDHVKAWEKKNQQFEAQNDKAHRELREQLLGEANRLGEEIRQKTKDLAASLARESQDLRGALTPKQQLAEILAQMALQLKGDAPEKRER
ncbi:MAG: hypothetical protein JNK85_09680 [Verrucomicrobiales bacterium]|nr:hypothetical protein [Verrucomicrobiales bacterium]